MPKIMPVSDLRNNFTEISRIVHEKQEPVFITRKGYGDMVVMSIEQYEAICPDYRYDVSLREAEAEALSGAPRKDFGEVAGRLREKLVAKTEVKGA